MRSSLVASAHHTISHCFVVRGDVTAIACDLWLLPTSTHPLWSFQAGWLRHMTHDGLAGFGLNSQQRWQRVPVEGTGNRVGRLVGFPQGQKFAEPLLVSVSVPEFLEAGGLDAGKFYSSDGLTDKERKKQHAKVAQWLAEGVKAFLAVASIAVR